MFCHVFSVQVEEIKPCQLFFRQLRDMPALTEGVGASHNDRILVKQISQLLERKEMSFFFMGFQPPVQFQNRLHGADG